MKLPALQILNALLLTALFAVTAPAQPARPVRVVIVGLVHGHVKGFLRNLPQSKDATLVGIVEPDKALAAQYEKQFSLEHALFHSDLREALRSTHPDAVLVYTTILDHRRVIEEAAEMGISSMVEKPLSTTMEDAIKIRDAARAYHVHVLVNYETTWYASNAQALQMASDGELGEIRKVVVHDGHEGPAEIGVGPEWLPWLTDPKRNGAGALFDLGCYGADLITVLRHGETPLSVTAVSQTDKPNLYPHVEDDATIIVRYPKMQAVLMPSWNWSFSRKDMEVYGTQGTAITVGADRVRVRLHEDREEKVVASPSLPASETTSLAYLAAVLHGKVSDRGDLSALDTNIIVMQILDAARTSAATGRTVALTPLPNENQRPYPRSPAVTRYAHHASTGGCLSSTRDSIATAAERPSCVDANASSCSMLRMPSYFAKRSADTIRFNSSSSWPPPTDRKIHERSAIFR